MRFDFVFAPFPNLPKISGARHFERLFLQRARR